jgi:hypothetical protein
MFVNICSNVNGCQRVACSEHTCASVLPFSVRNDHFFVVVLPVIIFRWTSVLLVRASILPVRVQFVCCMYNTGIILMDIWSACLNKRFHPRA